jgi:hypothetical protein
VARDCVRRAVAELPEDPPWCHGSLLPPFAVGRCRGRVAHGSGPGCSPDVVQGPTASLEAVQKVPQMGQLGDPAP